MRKSLSQKESKKLKVQLIFARLLTLLALTSLPYFCLVVEDLIVSLVINRAVPTKDEVAISLLR